MPLTPKALNLLSLARKGGRIQLGEEAVGAACRAGHARLVILASDAGGNVTRRANSFVHNSPAPLLCLSFTRDEIGSAVGRSSCAIGAITDVALALAFVEALDQPEQNSQLLQELQARVQRVQQRKQEEKAHQKNKRYGKKKQEVSK